MQSYNYIYLPYHFGFGNIGKNIYGIYSRWVFLINMIIRRFRARKSTSHRYISIWRTERKHYNATDIKKK